MLVEKILSKLRFSRLKWHDLKTIDPVSRKFGFDRGTPIDRYYIEKFLKDKSFEIKGRVLEVAESRYSKKFGSGVTQYDILHVEKTKNATIVGDLTNLTTLPENTIDCFVCTQVLNFIYDYKKAINGIYHVIKPGSLALVTVSGISQISRYDADQWGHFWSFYPQGITRSFNEVFGSENIEVISHGNSLSAISFLKGIAANELTKEELDYTDQDYPVTICILARKPTVKL